MPRKSQKMALAVLIFSEGFDSKIAMTKLADEMPKTFRFECATSETLILIGLYYNKACCKPNGCHGPKAAFKSTPQIVTSGKTGFSVKSQ